MINWNPDGRAVFFLEPHQDDGALFMAQVAAHHVLVRRKVHVVLMSSGATSSARGKVNGTQHGGGWWGGWHDPAREGYSELMPEEFAAARIREWSASWLQLGVPLERQHLGQNWPDALPDSISTNYAMDTIDYFSQQYPDAGFYAMHWADPNPDHAACGMALRSLRLADPHLDARWLVKPEEAAKVGAQPYAVPTELSAEIKAMQKRAAISYGAWAPQSGAYAIGMHSVADYFFTGPLSGNPNHIVRNP